ncbi:MAG: undecaprenyl-diphosphate phosphatase [Coriobacteriales bacterium]|nr:undecaprenyl-diphosphate phosphatase [Coriobacteriales bacterium]
MDVIELIKAAIIGIIEGITEWLPISSTGHMILADEFIRLEVSPEFWEMFLVVIQLGAICAVIILFFHKLNPFAPSKGREGRRKTWVLWAKVIVACIPAAIVGILLDSWFEEHFYNAITVAVALLVYGIAFIIVERVKGADRPRASGRHTTEALRAHAAQEGGSQPSALQALLPKRQPSKRGGGAAVSDVDHLGFGRAIGMGVFQVLAIVPGTSRSGSTILGGRILGVSREAAAEFSFFLAIPVMFGWSLLKLVKGFVLDKLVLTSTEWGVFVVGIVVAFVVSILTIRFLMGYIRRHSFEVFGWYRIVLGLVVLAFFAATSQLFVLQ